MRRGFAKISWKQEAAPLSAQPVESKCTERSRNINDGKALHFLEVTESRNVTDNTVFNAVKPECC